MKPLNVNDRVRIAGNPPYFSIRNHPYFTTVNLHGQIGIIEAIDPNPKSDGQEIGVRFGPHSYWCARRQLTKIVKPKERRRFWINAYPEGNTVAVVHSSKESAESKKGSDRVECIAVIEVKNK